MTLLADRQEAISPPESAKPYCVLFFATAVSQESGASYALRETVLRVGREGFRTVVVIPDCAASREMFPANEFNVRYLQILRPRQARNPFYHLQYLASLPKLLFALRQCIRGERVAIVHANEITDLVAALAAKLCSVRCVCHVRADGIPNPYRKILVLALERLCDEIVVPSKSTAAWLTAESTRVGKKTHLFYDYAFDAEQYSPSISGADFRAELAIGPQEALIVLVSKLVAIKGHECFIRAAALALEQDSSLSFVIVGGPVSGHEQEAASIQSLAAKLAIDSQRLRFVGARRDLPQIYAAADIVVHCPVYPDTYPTVVLLPMLMGKAIVGSNVGGIPEQIEDGVTGMLVEANNPTQLAQAIVKLVAAPEVRARLGKAALIRLRSEVLQMTQGQQLAQLYSDLISRCEDATSNP